MGYTMKHKKGAFPFKTDLTKKTGLGPRAEKKKVEKKNPDSSTDISAVPTFSDHMYRGLMNKRLLNKQK